jgi:hypothetical protein
MTSWRKLIYLVACVVAATPSLSLACSPEIKEGVAGCRAGKSATTGMMLGMGLIWLLVIVFLMLTTSPA